MEEAVNKATLSVQKDRDTYINEMLVSETKKFEDKERTLRDGHSDELSKLQNSNEQERLRTAALHKSEIDDHKSQISSLRSKFAELETSMQELIESHKMAIESLVTERDAQIADVHSKKDQVEMELKAEIKELVSVVQKSQNMFMVCNCAKLSKV
jgi:hypothetical protein